MRQKKSDFSLIRKLKKKIFFIQFCAHAIPKNLILAQSTKTFVKNLIVIKAYTYETAAASRAHFAQI